MRIFAMLLVFLMGCSSMGGPELYSASCAGLDIASTAYALGNGAEELNPLAIEGYEVASLILFSATAHWAIRHWTKKTYHDKGKAAPWWLGYGSYRCALAGWNLSQ